MVDMISDEKEDDSSTSTKTQLSGNISFRKKRSRAEVKCIDSDIGTLSTPLKFFDHDDEIEDLVMCVNIGKELSPGKLIFDETIQNPRKRRRLSMPVLPLSPSNFNPLDLFADLPQIQDTPKHQKKRKSLLKNLSHHSEFHDQKNNMYDTWEEKKGSISDEVSKAETPTELISRRDCVFENLPLASHVMIGESDASTEHTDQGKKIMNERLSDDDVDEPSDCATTTTTTTTTSANIDQGIVALKEEKINSASNDMSKNLLPAEFSSSEILKNVTSSDVKHDDANDNSCSKFEDESSPVSEMIHRPGTVLGSYVIIEDMKHHPNSAHNTEYISETSVPNISESSIALYAVPPQVSIPDCDKGCSSGNQNDSHQHCDVASLICVKKEEKADSHSHSCGHNGILSNILSDKNVKLMEKDNVKPEGTIVTVHLKKSDGDLAPERKLATDEADVVHIPFDKINLSDESHDTTASNLKAPLLNGGVVAKTCVRPCSLPLDSLLEVCDEGELTQSPKENHAAETAPATERSVRKTRSSTKIRKTLPKLQVRYTPMGLPRPMRVKKEEFSIEEIYLNKNFKTPTEKKWETIFEFPKEKKDGSVVHTEKQKKRRLCEFSTDPSQRKQKWKKIRQISFMKGKRKLAATLNQDSDKILSQKLFILDNALKLAELSP